MLLLKSKRWGIVSLGLDFPAPEKPEEADLLLEGESSQQIVHALLNRRFRVAEQGLVRCEGDGQQPPGDQAENQLHITLQQAVLRFQAP